MISVISDDAMIAGKHSLIRLTRDTEHKDSFSFLTQSWTGLLEIDRWVGRQGKIGGQVAVDVLNFCLDKK